MQTQQNRFNRLVLATLATIGTTVPNEFDPARDTKVLIRDNQRAQYAIAAANAIDSAVQQIAADRGVNIDDPKVYNHLMQSIAKTAFRLEEIELKGKFDQQLIAQLKKGAINETKAELPLTLAEQMTVVRYLGVVYCAMQQSPKVKQTELDEVFGAAFLNDGVVKIGEYFGQDVAQG